MWILDTAQQDQEDWRLAKKRSPDVDGPVAATCDRLLRSWLVLRDMVMCAGSSVSTAHGGWLAGAGSALVLYPAVLSTSVVQRLQPPPGNSRKS